MINNDISQVLDIQFTPVLFAGSLKDAFEHVNKKLSSEFGNIKHQSKDQKDFILQSQSLCV